MEEAKNGYSDRNTVEEVFNDYIKNTDLKDMIIRRKFYDHESHIKQHFGDIEIDKITQAQCLEFRSYLVENCNSINTVKTIWTIFKNVITYAMAFKNFHISLV